MKKLGVAAVSLMIGILAVCYVALSIVGIGIVKAAQHVGFLGCDFLYVFVLWIQYFVPPMMATAWENFLLIPHKNVGVSVDAFMSLAVMAQGPVEFARMNLGMMP
ncbi:hypothetical protein M8C21_007250, partial [Ambrosia artemisiifolia]